MVTVSPVYGTTTAMTCTLTGLTSDGSLTAGRETTAVDNSSVDAVDFLVGGKITTGTTPTAQRQIEIRAYGSYDGTEFTGDATGTDSFFGQDYGVKLQLKWLWTIPTTSTSDKTYRWGPCSIAKAFNGVVPVKWGLFITQNTGVSLNATASNHEVYYTPVKYESA